MEKPKILFVCLRNKWRSRTGEELYRYDQRVSVRSAGLSSTSPHVLSEKDLLWADLVLYMESDMLDHIKSLFPKTKLPKMIDLDIPSGYTYMDPELVDMLKDKVEAVIQNIP